MIDVGLLFAVLGGITLLLVLILVVRWPAFISLLISSIVIGLGAGMDPSAVLQSMQEGMGNTLGFVAVVVGLGAMFGAILEQSGGASALAQGLLRRFGEQRTSWALILTGLLIAIPVFFDVAFLILVPLIYALQRKSGKSLLYYALPLLAGLAISHAFIPPTPGPVAVADILQAELGWVILFGAIVAVPAGVVSGRWYAYYIAGKIFKEAPPLEPGVEEPDRLPSLGLIGSIIGFPILLILSRAVATGAWAAEWGTPDWFLYGIELLGHPFTALILANLLAWYALGIRGGFSSEELVRITTQSMAPAGVIILLTGAGGVLKQLLIDTGAGSMLAEYFAGQGIPVLLFAYLTAAIVRIIQGSATVAMITAAGLTAPLLAGYGVESEPMKALIVIAVAAGASIFSHVNDSGFWLVGQYLGMNEKESLRSWSMLTTVLSLSSILVILLLSLWVS